MILYKKCCCKKILAEGDGAVLRIFQVCFASGVLFTVLSFILGRVSDFSDMGTDIEAGVDMDADMNFDADLDIDADGGLELDTGAAGDVPELPVSPLKPIIITTFVTVFGGIGMICMIKGVSQAAAAVIALSAGLATSFLLHRFIIVPLYRAQNTSAISQKELRGALAKVTLAIRDNRFGKISYTMGGNTYSAPAKSVDGSDIERGVPVVIINIEKNVFYIKKIKGGF